jgi:hypothetical protein
MPAEGPEKNKARPVLDVEGVLSCFLANSAKK